MRRQILYHGTNGDNILLIIESGAFRPGPDGRIFFGQHDWSRVLQYGADARRKAAFAITVSVEMADGAAVQHLSTPGVPSTLVVITTDPLPATVHELYVRKPGNPHPIQIVGAAAIEQYLRAG
jgi:hypothetical protein